MDVRTETLGFFQVSSADRSLALLLAPDQWLPDHHFLRHFQMKFLLSSVRERKMRTKFFCTNFLNTANVPGHPGKIPGTSRIPLFETQGRQSFEGGHEVFGHHPFAWKTPTPPGGLRTQKLNLCALFSCLICGNPRRRGPSRTKKKTAIETNRSYYTVVFLVRPPYLLRRGPFLERKMSVIPRNTSCLHKVCRDSQSRCKSKFTTSSKFTAF